MLVVTELLATLQLCSGRLLELFSISLLYVGLVACTTARGTSARPEKVCFNILFCSVIPVHNGSFVQNETESLQASVLRVK